MTLQLDQELNTALYQLTVELEGLKELISFIIGNNEELPMQRLDFLYSKYMENTLQYNQLKEQVNTIIKNTYPEPSMFSWDLDFSSGNVIIK